MTATRTTVELTFGSVLRIAAGIVLLAHAFSEPGFQWPASVVGGASLGLGLAEALSELSEKLGRVTR